MIKDTESDLYVPDVSTLQRTHIHNDLISGQREYCDVSEDADCQQIFCGDCMYDSRNSDKFAEWFGKEMCDDN